MEEFAQTIAVGAGGLQHAALAEARRIMHVGGAIGYIVDDCKD